MYERVSFDVERYVEEIQSSPCFICRIVAGTHHLEHHVVYRDDKFIAFLDRYPTLVGKVLVAPIEHVEAVVADFTPPEYLELQTLIYGLGRAVSSVVPTERLYILSLGSQQGNSHVHWHIAPLPPGVPLIDQQYNALRNEAKGYLLIPEEDQRALAHRIAEAHAALDA